jgi:transcriptional regulator with XRE-family HTH domain
VDLAEALATRLRARRTELGLTLREVSLDAGVSLPYVANLEQQRGNPTLEVIEALARALRVRPLELLGSGDSSAGSEPPTPRPLLEFSRDRTFRATAKRLARRQRVPEKEMSVMLLGAFAFAARSARRALTADDYRRILDAYTLILTETPTPR